MGCWCILPAGLCANKCAVLQQQQPEIHVTMVATNHPWALRRLLVLLVVLLVVLLLLLLLLLLPRRLRLPRSRVLPPPLPPASAHAAKS